jgi:peptidyl-prolyl cis-trans isomerase C
MTENFDPVPVSIDGHRLPADRIQAEMQYHRAANAAEAWQEAARALVLKTLLHKRAMTLGLAPEGDPLDPEFPTDWIDALLEVDIQMPEASEEAYRRFHAAYPGLFEEPMAAEAQHILLAAPQDDAEARSRARALAEDLIAEVTADPRRFEALAGKYSACPSAPLGGHLGLVERGSAVEEFETYLFSLQDGELCPVPIETRYGVHVLRANKRRGPRPSQFETVRERVSEEFDDRRWRNALRAYLRDLAKTAEIVGIDFA